MTTPTEGDSSPKSQPIVNILTRTSNRPNFFKTCCESINQQNYPNINHIIGCDDKDSIPYVKDYTSNYIYVDPNKYKHNKNKSFWYHKNNESNSPAWWNSYFNDMYSLLKPGWVMFLDDDDQFTYNNSLKIIMDYHPQSTDYLKFWLVGFPNNVIPRINSPSLEFYPPSPANISGIGFMFHTNFIQYAEWEPWAYGDFRVSYSLWENIPNKIQINEVLTKLQSSLHFGNKTDK